MPDDSRPGIDPVSRDIIRRKARQLVGKAGLAEQDREDIEQELQLRLLQRLGSFHPAKGRRHGLIATVIHRCALNLLRDRFAKKRDYRRLRPLGPSALGEGRAVEPVDTGGAATQEARPGPPPHDEQERVDLACDLAEVFAQLPPDLRDLAERLKYQTLSEIARETGVPRTSLYGPVRQLLQQFERAGLREYL